MNIRKLYYLHHKIAFLRARYFLILAVLFALLAVYGLRDNYSNMVKLRDAVYVADQQNGDVEAALKELREHVYSHMNTNLTSGNNAIKPPVQLKARYDRLVAAEKQRVAGLNMNITAQAEQICAQQFPAAGFNAPRVACIQDYFATRSIKETPVPDALYKFDFISPRWSPDLAGFSILLSVTFFVLFLVRYLLERYMQKRLQ